MYRSLATATCLLLAGCATSSPDSRTGASIRQPVENDTSLPTFADVREIDISSLPDADDVVCRRRAPTGSRIAVERCYMPNEDLEERLHDISREQLKMLREQQMIRDRARQRAIQDAIQRRARRGGRP